MKHIKKFNENLEDSKNTQFKIIGDITKDELDGEIEIGDELYDLPDGTKVKEGRCDDYEFCLITKGDEILVAIYEYEISNPFVFGDVIIVPGNDSTTVYNYKTGESKTGHTR